MDASAGSLVKLVTKDGSFEGLIHGVDRVNKRITLEKGNYRLKLKCVANMPGKLVKTW